MDKIIIKGGKPLKGDITISGAKNAALPLMTAALLTDEPLRFSNMPRLADINTMSDLLIGHGVKVTLEAGNNGSIGRVMTLETPKITSTTAPYDIVRKMRASILVLGPLLAREGEATVSLPGGCAIGNRPIDLHLKALEKMGAEIELTEGYVRATAPNGLKGAEVRFPMISVGATENILMAATLAKGTTVIENAAREPEITDLARCLVKMGAKIEGLGTERLVVEGQSRLHGADHEVMADRIEAGSYAIAAGITGGSLKLKGVSSEVFGAALELMREAGLVIEDCEQGVHVSAPEGKVCSINATTQPFPGFATDMQAQVMAMMCLADGASVIVENIFENRFMHVPELGRMGADIKVNGGTATIRGVDHLIGAPVMATDLRASMCLVLAGLAAQGTTEISRVYHLDRGYEHLEEKLSAVGADIERVSA
ncbi:MAG: UDP-N-acetylglucosamine 1-carboxyvinyltransferase [Sphingomonadales bacterium]|jgi:UDP-N-acetylglucosamine 1-carboxyvinyltransferase